MPGADTTALYQSLVQRLTGVPNSRINEYAELRSISAVSADDIWAVGRISANGPSTSVNHTLIEHWNGQQWQLIAGPDVAPAMGYTSLLGVAALAANDAWAVGQINPPSTSSSSTPQPTTTLPQVIVEHWDGQSWQSVPLPAAAKTAFYLSSVTASSSDNVWVVGAGSSGYGTVPLAMHWDGQNWHLLSFPASFPQATLDTAASDSAGNLWVIGQGRQSDGTQQPVVVYWNGKQWSTLAGLKDVKAILSATMQQETDSYLTAIAANNPHDVWVTGQTAAGHMLMMERVGA